MGLQRLLEEKKPELVKQWFQSIIHSYPENTATFLNAQKNQFANPLGHTFRTEAERILDGLLQNKPFEEIQQSMDGIVRIMAIQDFTPSQAMFFAFQLKDVVRGAAESLSYDDLVVDLLRFETKIDQLVLMGFDRYMKFREQVWELKADTIRNRTHKILEKTGLWRDLSQVEEDADEHTQDRATEAR